MNEAFEDLMALHDPVRKAYAEAGVILDNTGKPVPSNPDLMWGGTPPNKKSIDPYHNPQVDFENTRKTKVCKDKKDPWYGQDSSTYGYKESMYAISPNSIGMK